MNASCTSVFDADRARLATLLDISPDDGDGTLWRDEDLGVVLRHQLSAPMGVDLVNLERGAARRVRALAESQGLALKSFGDLLTHPNPPVELLRLTKDFAKACRLSPRGPMPREIATVLYFASIAAALVRCRHRNTNLSNDALADWLRWVCSCPWLDESTRAIVGEGVAFLSAPEEERHG
jgi:hypothetical protein